MHIGERMVMRQSNNNGYRAESNAINTFHNKSM